VSTKEAVQPDDPPGSGVRLLPGVYRGTIMFEVGVIRISMGAAAVERLLTHQLVEWRICPQALDEIRVGDE
jgi:hypothetical protein